MPVVYTFLMMNLVRKTRIGRARPLMLKKAIYESRTIERAK